jgi:hypothetical protein
MGRHYNVLLFILALSFLAFGFSMADKSNIDIANQSLSNPAKINKANNFTQTNEDCLRGQAEPIIKKDVYPNTTFVLQADSLTAIETVKFDNGDNLTIRNWGCEYYVLTFRYETSRPKADTTNLKYWYVNSVKFINQIEHGIKAPIDIKKGINALNRYISTNAFNLKLNKDIDFGINEVRNFITLESISQIDKNRFVVTFSFVVGPL